MLWEQAFLPLVMVAQIIAGLGFGLYLGRWQYDSFDEAPGLATAVGTFAVALFVIDAATGVRRTVPLSATLGAGFIALVLMGGVRYAVRLGSERRNRPSHVDVVYTPVSVRARSSRRCFWARARTTSVRSTP